MKFAPWIVSIVSLAALGWLWTDSQSKLSQKDAELATLREQYNQLVADSNTKLSAAAEAHKQLAEEADKRLEELKNEATEKLQEANQPEVQVKVAFRKALVSNGNVAMITNTSNSTSVLSLEIKRPASNDTKAVPLTLDSGRTREIGEREGWAFVTGDTITVSQPGHKTVSFSL